MESINANTKIAAVLKQHPDAMDAIISISPKFNKLKIPLLRKVMAPRTSIAMASKIAACSVNDFFDKLEPLGFPIDRAVEADDTSINNDLPSFMQKISPENTVDLDVRPEIEAGNDPLSLIMKKTKEMKAGQVLKLVNSFEPTPLIQLLEKRGFASHTETVDDSLVHTFFYKESLQEVEEIDTTHASEGWDEVLQRFGNELVSINVMDLEMPQPMHTILEELGKLPDNKALFVYHKRIPVYLIPELEELGFEYRAKEISDTEVQMIIFRT